MFFKQPIPMVIMRAGKILISTSLVSRFSSMVVDYQIMDCVGREDFIFPSSWFANRMMEIETTMIELGCLNFLWKSENSRHKLDDIGNRAFKNIADNYKEQLAQITKNFNGGGGDAGMLGIDKAGCVYEFSIPTFSQEEPVPGGCPLINFSFGRDVHYLPCNSRSEWAYSSDQYNQALLRVALASTTTTEELSELLIKTGLNKSPVWVKYSDFINTLDLQRTGERKLRETYNRSLAVYYKERELLIENDKVDEKNRAEKEATKNQKEQKPKEKTK